MKNLLLLLPAIAMAAFPACKPKTASDHSGTAAPDTLQYELRTFTKQHCVQADACADFSVIYPLFSGKNSGLANAVNQAVQARICMGLQANPGLPFEVALDSAGKALVDAFLEDHRQRPDLNMGYLSQVTGNVLLDNDKIVTVRLDFASFTGGAHPNSAVAVLSFDLANGGRELKAADLLRDTMLVLPLLEKAYKNAKGLPENADIGELLLTENKKLPLPANVGVLPEGLLFAYGDYEVAPHAVGPADLILTWEELGASIDREKLIDVSH